MFDISFFELLLIAVVALLVLGPERLPKAARFAGLTESAFRDRGSTIYRFYEEAFGISVVRTRERLRATRADAAAARLLGVPPGSPLLTIRRIAQSYRDVPVEYRVSRVDTARHEYWADVGS